MKKTLLLIVAILTTTIAFASVEIDGIYYNFNDSNQTAEVTYQYLYWDGDNYSGVTSITIPEKVTYNSTEYSVTSIGSWAFHSCLSLTSITIPNSVNSIENYAFENCSNITEIHISDIAKWCNIDFKASLNPSNPLYNKNACLYVSGNKITELIIPEGVDSIKNYAFYNCDQLISVTISNSVTSIGNSAFSSCSSLTFITIPNSVTSIGSSAFQRCSSLTSITIPNSVTSIGSSAFYECSSLTSITIPNSVTSIGNYTFYDCSSLTSITIPNSVTSIGEHAFCNCDALTSIIIPNSVTSIGSSAFYSCEALTSITIPNSVTSIGESAFYNCSSLTSITIPNSVTSIGYSAFEDCSSLSSAIIGNGVKLINNYIFEECSKLRTIKLGNSVESIGKDAFKGCTALYSFEISTEIPPIIDATTFAEVSSTLQIKVPCNAVEDYKASNHWNSFSNFKANPYSLTVKTNNNTMGEAFIIKQPNCQDITAQVQAQALPGYEFVKWSDGFTENPHTIYVTRDTTITAEFRKINEEPENKHNIFIVESADKTQGDVTITITANAIKGFEFSHWSDGSTENPRIVTLDENIELYAYFKVAENTNVETSKISSANIYTTNGTLHIEGATENYHILDAAGRLIYSGNASTLQLPRGIYLITINGEVEKIAL